jgi:hypothetical protein
LVLHTASFQAKETKAALKAISNVDEAERSKIWIQFAKDNKVSGLDCLSASAQ